MRTAQKSNAVTTLRAYFTTTPLGILRALTRTFGVVGHFAAGPLSIFNHRILASPGRDYEPLCEDLGRDKRACIGARVLIILATTFAPTGSLTSKDAIAVASVWIGLSKYGFDALTRLLRVLCSMQAKPLASSGEGKASVKRVIFGSTEQDEF